jgi:hypothetical protein
MSTPDSGDIVIRKKIAGTRANHRRVVEIEVWPEGTVRVEQENNAGAHEVVLLTARQIDAIADASYKARGLP